MEEKNKDKEHVHSYDFCICAADEIRTETIEEIYAWLKRSDVRLWGTFDLIDAIESKFLEGNKDE